MPLHVQDTLGTGLLVLLPIGVTVLIFKFFFNLLDPILQNTALTFLPGPKIPGLGLIALVVLVYLVGLVATRVIGRRLIERVHHLAERIPVVKGIYSTTRSAVGVFSLPKTSPYCGVVLLEFPRAGMMSIGLITSRLGLKNGEELVAVYVPTAPVPSSGFLVIAKTKDLTPTDMSVDYAMKVIVSGGILAGDFKELFVQSGGPSSVPAEVPADVFPDNSIKATASRDTDSVPLARVG